MVSDENTSYTAVPFSWILIFLENVEYSDFIGGSKPDEIFLRLWKLNIFCLCSDFYLGYFDATNMLYK